jgi:16S rRNA (guanine966-N2)-methyltransferase
VRIISGAFKGRRLVAPTGLATRPTADRIKESLFNIISGRIRDKQVLDLFAGTGALGLEALSRGATHAVFIDHAKAALSTIRENISKLRVGDRTRVIQWDIARGLNCLASDPATFDLVFMDPPYETDCVVRALGALIASGALAPGALIVIEHSAREPLDFPVGQVAVTDQRRFGKTLVTFMDNMV